MTSALSSSSFLRHYSHHRLSFHPPSLLRQYDVQSPVAGELASALRFLPTLLFHELLPHPFFLLRQKPFVPPNDHRFADVWGFCAARQAQQCTERTIDLLSATRVIPRTGTPTPCSCCTWLKNTLRLCEQTQNFTACLFSAEAHFKGLVKFK
jgi:hypothetical protein